MRTTVEQKKQLLLTRFTEGRQIILDTALLIPPGNREQVFLGTWSIQDVLAHMIGWDYANLAAIEAVNAGQLPEFYQHIDKDWRSYNAYLVSLYRKDDLNELVKDAQVSQQTLAGAIAELPAGKIFQDNGVRYRGYRVTIARLVEADIKDVRVHLEQIERFIDGLRREKQKQE